ncbi:MAG TPA: alpha/beta hydrolase [Victivallales bacterium]|nr:alpha/beta hydrolase [Victivallales bacterium]
MKKKSLLYHLNYYYWFKYQKSKLDSRSRIIETSKGPIEYYIHGDSGPAVIGIHGTPGSIFQCEYLFYGLKNAGFRLISWGRPGYLKTPLNGNLSYKDQADLMAALLDSLKIKSAGIISYSCGGTIAIEFATRHPGRTDAVILDAPAAFKISWDPCTFIKKILAMIIFNNFGSWMTALLSSVFPYGNILYLINRMSDESLIKDMKTSYLIYKDKKLRYLILEYLIDGFAPYSMIKKGCDNDRIQCLNIDKFDFKKMKQPTLILHGTKDGEIPLNHSQYIKSKLSNVELFIIENANHLVLLTHKKLVINKKKQFLKEHLF